MCVFFFVTNNVILVILIIYIYIRVDGLMVLNRMVGPEGSHVGRN